MSSRTVPQCFFTDVAHAAPGLEANMSAAAQLLTTAPPSPPPNMAETLLLPACDVHQRRVLAVRRRSVSATSVRVFNRPGTTPCRAPGRGAARTPTPRGRAETEASDGRLVVTRQTAVNLYGGARHRGGAWLSRPPSRRRRLDSALSAHRVSHMPSRRARPASPSVPFASMACQMQDGRKGSQVPRRKGGGGVEARDTLCSAAPRLAVGRQDPGGDSI
jgi:hypothetical protein